MKFNNENRSKTTAIRYDTRIDFTFAKCRESIKWTQYQRVEWIKMLTDREEGSALHIQPYRHIYLLSRHTLIQFLYQIQTKPLNSMYFTRSQWKWKFKQKQLNKKRLEMVSKLNNEGRWRRSWSGWTYAKTAIGVCIYS